LVQIPSVVQDLSGSQNFYGHRWLTLTFEPVTFSMSSGHLDLLTINCDQFH